VTTQSEETGLRSASASYAYNGDPVVHDVSFRLEPGAMVAIAGPNGSGKTTLLKMLSGIYRPERGEVYLDGMKLASVPPRRLAQRIAVVTRHIDPRLMFSVAELVAMGRTPYIALLDAPKAHDRRAIREALAFCELEHLAHRRYGELSGGEQQRVMLAMALAQEADYLLLDEPTVHLDLRHQYELLELLCRLRTDRHTGIAAVMHDLNLASLYFDRMALMQAGRLVADADAGEILRRPEYLSVFQAPLSVVAHPRTGVPQVLLERGPGHRS
jgi:iron complex transport system ATP-binding protein